MRRMEPLKETERFNRVRSFKDEEQNSALVQKQLHRMKQIQLEVLAHLLGEMLHGGH